MRAATDGPSSAPTLEAAGLDRRTARRLAALRRRAWRALAWERAAPLLWPVAAIVAVFTAAAFSGLPLLLPGPLHVAGLALTALALAAALVRAARRWRRPDPMEIERRIETDSGAAHRPLAALRDGVDFSGGDASARALWAAHLARSAAGLRRLTVRRARPDMAAADPWGLRQLALLLLLVTAVGARGDWGPRLVAALSPSFDAASLGPGAAGVTVEAWLAPPEATGAAPIFLPVGSPTGPRGTDGAATPVPQGARLTARAAGTSGGAPLTLRVNDGEQAFEVVDGRNQQVEATVTRGNVIAVVRRGAILAEWRIQVISDEPPEAAFVGEPTATERGGLRIDYLAADDYGLARIKLRVVPQGEGDDDSDHGPGGAAAVEETAVPLPGVRPKQARGGGVFDFTANLWAGLPATLTLIAEDAGGQFGESEPVDAVLPERRFAHPVARALVAERRRLTLEGERARASVEAALRLLAARPEAFRGDAAALLGVAAAAGRLAFDYGPRSVREAQNLMWEAALRIEDGGAAQAERAVRQARQALDDALERGASDAELRALMDRLQGAMDAWLDALEQQMRQAQQNGEPPPALPPELAERMTDRGELQTMLDRMRSMAETGARDAARRMLSQLQQMMDRMQTAGPDQGVAERNQAFDLMRRLRELAEKQQELQDDTFRLGARAGGEGEDPAAAARRRPPRDRLDNRRKPTASPLMLRQAERQQELRRGLGEAMRELGELSGDIPRPLGRAEREMREAENALRGGAPDAATEPQGEAVQALREGLQDFAEKVLEQMAGAMAGAGQAQPGAGGAGRGRDPLGRQAPQGEGGSLDVNSVKTPTEADIQRARDIMQELRRRAGETARPPLEREYIDRLLRRF
jgi:uncharacterized protein (TIGR02302 family)